MSLSLKLLHKTYLLSLKKDFNEFMTASHNPLIAQQDCLKKMIKNNKETLYGKKYQFDKISSVKEFQNKVPIVDYDEIESCIKRIAAGEKNILTSDPVLMMEKTGGSTSANKFIPYTKSLKDQFSKTTNPWLFNIYKENPNLQGTQSYWSISPVTRLNEKTEGGLPIGFEDDSEYFGPISRMFIKKMMAVPSSVARLPSFDEWRRQTIIYLLESENLGLISIWNPTFLTLLMDHLKDNLSEYLNLISIKRKNFILKKLELSGVFNGEALWPNLQLLSTWTSGNAQTFLKPLIDYFPKTKIQGKGLLATEGVISFPLWGQQGSALSVTSHFLEFIDLNQPAKTPLLAHELQVGGQYSPLITTAGGLYRYHLKDKIKCLAMFNKTPLIDFDGKLDHISDLCGEKLHAQQVLKAFELAKENSKINFDFATITPILDSVPYYCLFIETDSPKEKVEIFVNTIEKELLLSHHYKYCIELGQLKPIKFKKVVNGWQTYQKTLMENGIRAGDIKPTHFDTKKIWKDVFI
jgi:hypothetical protein